MRYRFLLPLLLIATPGCSTVGTVRDIAAVATSPTPIGDFTVVDDRAMYAGEALYNVIAQPYVSANSRGLVPASLKATLKPMLVYAGDLLKALRAAKKVGDVPGFNARYKALKALQGTVLPLIPKG